jgi:hypothetical protein
MRARACAQFKFNGTREMFIAGSAALRLTDN